MIYTTLLIKQGQVSYFACVVFLSICVSHGLEENPFLFAWNRILDTCIGILVALFVNRMALPFHRASKRLYPVSYTHLNLGKMEDSDGIGEVGNAK